VPLPDVKIEPVDTGDFADYLAGSVGNAPVGRLADFGGPEVLTFSEAFDRWRQFRQRPVRTMRIPLPAAVSNAAGAMSISDPDSRRGTVTWVDWLSTHTAE
jgi:uncharacterized protein YbjT (DUF2867 family)